MNKPRLIVADNDDGFRALLADVLGESGFEVLKAANGAQVLQHCERYSVAIAIVDLAMPEREGFDTIFELRRRFPAIRTLAICGHGRTNPENCLRMAKLIGASATLVKPFGTVEMLESVRRLLDLDSIPA